MSSLWPWTMVLKDECSGWMRGKSLKNYYSNGKLVTITNSQNFTL